MMPRRLLELSVILISVSGCHIDIRLGDQQQPKASDTIVVVAADKATIAEIDAVMKLDFDHSRTAALRAIAKRENLSEQAQVHLVKRTMRGIAFDNMKLEILQDLVANPAFSERAKAELMKRLDALTFESFKSQMLKAINEREAAGTQPEK